MYIMEKINLCTNKKDGSYGCFQYFTLQLQNFPDPLGFDKNKRSVFFDRFYAYFRLGYEGKLSEDPRRVNM